LDFDKLEKKNARENLELAFEVAEKELGIPRLLVRILIRYLKEIITNL
jgi:hypothetical protein